MKVLLTGATGFIGTRLASCLERAGHGVTPVSRRPGVGCTWDPDDIRRNVTASDVVIHLAGAGVLDRRWSSAYKHRILSSRVETTQLLASACARASRPIVSTSAVGYYGPHPMDAPQDEDAAPGDDFLAQVCRAWEGALDSARAAGAPVAVVRVGIALGAEGGALRPLRRLFRLGLGGPIGSGRFPFPWVHVDDVCRLFLHLAEHPERTGPHNAVAPRPCDQRTFARTLGRVLRRPALLPTPPLALRLVLGERSHALTTGQHVVPRRTLESGFEFAHPDLEPALRDLLRQTRAE